MDANRMLAGLSREEKVVIFVIGTTDNLKAKGVLEGGAYRLDAKGKATYDALVASGFIPTEAEMNGVMDTLNHEQ